MYVTWGLVRNLQLDKPIPADIQIPKEYDQNADIIQRRRWAINEWELEFILAQAFLYCPHHIITGYSLKESRNLGPLVDNLRKFEDNVYKLIFTGDPNIVFREFFRVAHRQFPWQQPMTTPSFDQ